MTILEKKQAQILMSIKPISDLRLNSKQKGVIIELIQNLRLFSFRCKFQQIFHFSSLSVFVQPGKGNYIAYPPAYPSPEDRTHSPLDFFSFTNHTGIVFAVSSCL